MINGKRIVVVLPAYNAEKTLEAVVRELPELVDERILVDDEVVKLARLALVAATAQVLHNGLTVLGVSAPQKM